MSRRFLFPCPKCNHEIELVIAQAGQHMTCPSCNHQFEAPKLGILRQLPPVGDQQPSRSSHSTVKPWLFSGGLLLAVVMGLLGAGLYWYASGLIVDVDLAGIQKDWGRSIDEMQPDELLEHWDAMAFESGLGEWQEQLFARYKTQGTYLQYVSYGLFGLAAIGITMICCSFLLKDR